MTNWHIYTCVPPILIWTGIKLRPFPSFVKAATFSSRRVQDFNLPETFEYQLYYNLNVTVDHIISPKLKYDV